MISGPPRLPRPAVPETARSPRVAALAAAVSASGGGRDAGGWAEERFWDEAARTGTPLVEPIPGDPHHRAVTFLCRGTPDTGGVIAMVNRLFDPMNPFASGMRRVDGTGVWYVTYRLRTDHLGSYRMVVLEGDDPRSADLSPRAMQERGVPDPFNPWSIPTRWADTRASVFELPDAPVPPWRPWADAPGVPHGTVSREQVPSAALGADRETWVYLPPGPAAATLVLLEGDMWFGKLGIQAMFDRLITNGTIPPLAVLSPHAISNPTRMRDLGGHEGFAHFLTCELLPWARGRAKPLPSPTLLAGESLGGLTALKVGLESSGRFDGVLAQSTSTWWKPSGGTGAADCWIAEQYARAARRDLRVHLRVGVHEWTVLQQHRDLHETVEAQGFPVSYSEYNGGHDYVCWARGLCEGLSDLLAHDIREFFRTLR
jgi:enterochelin esterase-like enzyme